MNGLPISHSGPLVYLPSYISSLYISTDISSLCAQNKIHIFSSPKLTKYVFKPYNN